MAILSVRGVTRTFGPVRALVDANMEFLPGEIHAVLGENGAGKSTLMNVISGFLKPDRGEISLDGAALPMGDPLKTRALGIEMVHQHFMLIPEFTVAENLAMARLATDGDGLRGRLRLEKLAEPALKLAKKLGWAVDPGRRTGDLPVGVQQRVEILKALSSDAPVLILDEPTAVLAPAEVDDLFRVLRTLRDQGKTLLLIAHKLSEIMEIADRATVLRRGQQIGSSLIAETTAQQLAEWMVGEVPAPTVRSEQQDGNVLVTARDVHVRGSRGEEAVRGVSFEVRAGEVLGVGGVDGNGQVELAEALVGVRPVASGHVARPERLGYIPQDRHVDGLALGMSIEENLLILGQFRADLRQGPFLKSRAVKDWAQGLVESYRIKIGKLQDPAKSLSGGNQQKLVVSRTLSLKPELLVAVNPTRGLDFNATRFVHESIQQAAADGAAVILISTDLDELAELAHRTLFMSAGRLEARDIQSVLAGEAT